MSLSVSDLFVFDIAIFDHAKLPGLLSSLAIMPTKIRKVAAPRASPSLFTKDRMSRKRSTPASRSIQS